MTDDQLYTDKQGDELTEKELFKDKSDDEVKALKFFCGIPIKSGCFKKEYLSIEGYQKLVDAKKGEIDFKEKAISKLGIDEDQCKEINPVSFEGPRYTYKKLQPLAKWIDGKFFSSMYEITWLFFGEEQVYVYNFAFDTTDATAQEKTQEYFYSDINAFATQSDNVEKKTWIVETTTCGSDVKQGKKMFNEDLFKIVVPGEAYECSFPNTDEDNQSVSAMKQKLRDSKTKDK